MERKNSWQNVSHSRTFEACVLPKIFKVVFYLKFVSFSIKVNHHVEYLIEWVAVLWSSHKDYILA
jgi:hypothetical protein